MDLHGDLEGRTPDMQTMAVEFTNLWEHLALLVIYRWHSWYTPHELFENTLPLGPHLLLWEPSWGPLLEMIDLEALILPRILAQFLPDSKWPTLIQPRVIQPGVIHSTPTLSRARQASWTAFNGQGVLRWWRAKTVSLAPKNGCGVVAPDRPTDRPTDVFSCYRTRQRH